MAIRIRRKDERQLNGKVIEKKQSGSGDLSLTIKSFWERPYLCKGKENLGNEIKEGDYIEISGFFKKKPGLPSHYLDYFEFHYYKIIPAPEIPQKTTVSNPVNYNLTKVLAFMKEIGNEIVTYEFHDPQTDTIAHHVHYQLKQRVTRTVPSRKDLFFLTAFLDRHVFDYQVQSFRQKTPNFKELLIQCWNEAEELLTKAIYTNEIVKFDDIANISPTFKQLYEDAPGGLKLNQLSVCLNIINEIYKRKEKKRITYICRKYSGEKMLRKYLLDLSGVRYKIANLALTNVTGHWFVIDNARIKEVLEKEKKLYNTVGDLKISPDNADPIFKNWFGEFNEEDKSYSNISLEQFLDTFPDFSPEELEYLPFIVTQYLWFYWASNKFNSGNIS